VLAPKHKVTQIYLEVIDSANEIKSGWAGSLNDAEITSTFTDSF
jgi:hypothetical protein